MLNKISSKLILAVGGTTITVFVIFSYFMIRSQHRDMISQVEHHAHQTSETIKSGTKYDMLLNRRDDIHHIIDTIGRQEESAKSGFSTKTARSSIRPRKERSGRLSTNMRVLLCLSLGRPTPDSALHPGTDPDLCDRGES